MRGAEGRASAINSPAICRDVNLVKLGGSVITHKRRSRPTARRAMIPRLARIIAAAGPAIVVHGAGSFGHPLAEKYQLKKGADEEAGVRAAQVRGAAQTLAQVRRLNALLCDALTSAGAAPAVLFPSSFVTTDDRALVVFPAERFAHLLELGFMPVTCGDVVADTQHGFTILSGDTLMVALARALRPQRALFVLDEPGVWDDFSAADRRIIPELDRAAIEAMLRREQASADASVTGTGADVTGGLWGKLRAALEIAPHCECRIVGVEGFAAALAGESAGRQAGTRVVA